MSPIHRIQDLTIDFSRLGAIELHGEPIRSRNCSVKLSFTEDNELSFHQIRFKKYGDACKLYEQLTKKWVHFEKANSNEKLIREAEKELHF